MANLPTVKQLRYIVQLQKTRHFRKASEACFVTQSTFSSAIKELESALQVSLVDRSNRKVVFTEPGLRVANKAQLVLAELQEIVDIAEEANVPLGGTLKLGAIPTIAPFVIPKMVPAIRQSYESLKLAIVENTSATLLEQLHEGELDAVVLALPYDLANTSFYPLFEDSFHFAYHEKSSLVDSSNMKRLGSLAQDSVLLLDDEHCMRAHALAAMGKKNRTRVNKSAAAGLHSLVKMVDSDLGVTFLPQLAIDAGLLNNTGLKTFKLEKAASRNVVLAWRASSARSDEFGQLAELLKESMHH